MRARTLGRFALLLIAILLVVDVLRNLPGEAEPLGEGPTGFPWPTRGLGEISLGMEGRFLLDLEERIETGEGGSERVPQMSLAGTDPRPREGGMGLRDAVIDQRGKRTSPAARRGHFTRRNPNATEAMKRKLKETIDFDTILPKWNYTLTPQSGQ